MLYQFSTLDVRPRVRTSELRASEKTGNSRNHVPDIPIGRFEIDYLDSEHNLSPAITDAEYERLLFNHLTDRNNAEILFFRNKKRFFLMDTLVGDGLRNNFKSILNVACGPFAFENYFNLPDNVEVDSFDNDQMLVGLYKNLKNNGYLSNCKFMKKNIDEYENNKRYDLVLINDLFYTKNLNFYDYVEKYTDMIKPNGFLYFDLLDTKIGWLWSLLGKDNRYRRYDLSDVQAAIEKNGLEVVTIAPSLGIKGGFDNIVRSWFYWNYGIANNFIFVCWKPPS